MATMIRQTLWTVAEVAESIGVTTGRIRQICIEHGFGQIVGNTRVLADAEVDAIRNLPDRRKKSADMG